MMLRSAAAGLLCLLLGGCDLFTGGFRYGSVKVSAEDRAGAPVPGVRVDLYRPDFLVGVDTTGEDGTALIDNVAERLFLLRVEVPEPYFLAELSDTIFEQRRDTILNVVVKQGEQAEVRVQLRLACCGTLRLRAADSTGAPLPGTRAVLLNRTVPVDSATTGLAGTLSFADRPDGIYGLRVRAPTGYAFRSGADSTFNVRIRQGLETAVNLVIRRAPATTAATAATAAIVAERRRVR